ncbi:MAG: hypothetical protein ACKPJP_17910 [Microcystis panniformis]
MQSIPVPEIVEPGSVYWWEYMSKVRSPKSIGAVVGLASGNAPHIDGVLLRSAFGIAL